MKNITVFIIALFSTFLYFILSCSRPAGDTMTALIIKPERIESTITGLVSRHGEPERDRIESGVRQVAGLWNETDGDESAFTDFCMEHYISDPVKRSKLLARFEKNLESLRGHLLEIQLDFHEPMDLDIGPMLPADYLFAGYVPDAHVDEDLFKSKIAFSAILNFKIHSLEEKLKAGAEWTRDEWAAALLAGQFSARVAPEATRKRAMAGTTANNYISNYNIFMHHVLTGSGRRLFPSGMKLISHWNLRDELKSRYAGRRPEDLEAQELIYTVMQRIIQQEIPKAVINNPTVDWDPAANTVSISPVEDYENFSKPLKVSNDPEPDTRYAHLLSLFHAEQALDPYYPGMPTLIKRRFQQGRQIPEEKVRKLFTDLLSSEAVKKTGKLIEKRLGRKLRPYDIWYNGFKPEIPYTEAELTRITSRKYPTPEAFQKDIPRILRMLGFETETIRLLKSKIEVDPARGVGHAWGAAMRQANAHLRTRVFKTGMDYKAYNIAVHELGHNVEQVLSLNKIDHTLLNGVPNTGFTEAFAFVFQARDLALLGLNLTDPRAEHLRALQNLWSTYEIAGVALLDMEIWHWMYDHPNATAAELKAAMIETAQKIWNAYYAPVFGVKNVFIHAIYSHMIYRSMYIPDYPLGHIIAFQVESYLKGKDVGPEMERMCALGAITPDQWMKEAIGEPISVRPMIEAAETALQTIH
jgi:hypothetical protein